MASKFKKYVYTIVCSIAILDKKNKFKGFLSSDKYKRDYCIKKDGKIKFNNEINDKLKKIALINLNKKILKINKEGKFFTFGPIIFR